MTNTENVTEATRLIPLAKLELSNRNARRTGRGNGIDELKASILSHGLMQNLVVTEADDAYRVIAGGRRLEALRALQAEGRLPAGYTVPCQIATEEQASELSLAENVVRRSMHPADEFEAFAALIDQGQTAAQVAERFGVDESHVLKRFKLGRVAPELLTAYREEQISLESLMAFAITDDRKRQLKVYKSLKSWQKDDPRQIRASLTEKMVEADSKLARFVGMDAYLAAGGTVRQDLFGDESYLEQPELLQKLAANKLDAVSGELEAEGWGWVEVNVDRDWDFVQKCSRVTIDAEDPRQRAFAGCYLTIGHDGDADVTKGLVKPEDRKALARLQSGDDAQEVKAKPKDGLSHSLLLSLADYRLQVAQAEIARHPAIASDLLTFHAARSILANEPLGDGPQVLFKPKSAGAAIRKEATPADQALAAIAATLPVQWLKGSSQAAQFAAFQGLSDAEKQGLLAYCVAVTLQPRLAPAIGEQATACDAAFAQTGADVAAYWRPTRDNFLSRLTRDQLLSVIREIFGEQIAQSRRHDKKGELVDQLDRAFAEPEKHGRTAEQIERLKSWLPVRMGSGFQPASAKPAKAKKARKAA